MIIALVVFAALFVFVCDSLTPSTSDVCICCMGTFSNTGAQQILGGRLWWEPYYVWIQDSTQILYHYPSGEVFMINFDTSRLEVEQKTIGLVGQRISITSDGNLLNLNTAEFTAEVLSMRTFEKIYSVTNAYSSIISPDGHHLVTGNRDGNRFSIDLFNLDIVNQTIERMRSIEGLYSPYAWSVTGKYLTLLTTIPDKAVNGLAGKLLLWDMSTQRVYSPSNLPGCQYMPTWSPDDRQVIFSANPELWNWNLFQVAIGEDEAKFLTDTPEMDEFQPDWSPDGESIVYVGFKVISDPVSEQELYRLDLSSGDVERLTNTPDEHESYPRWSPDGQKIAYLSYADNTWYLNVMNLDGSGQVRLATIGEGTR